MHFYPYKCSPSCCLLFPSLSLDKTGSGSASCTALRDVCELCDASSGRGGGDGSSPHLHDCPCRADFLVPSSSSTPTAFDWRFISNSVSDCTGEQGRESWGLWTQYTKESRNQEVSLALQWCNVSPVKFTLIQLISRSPTFMDHKCSTLCPQQLIAAHFHEPFKSIPAFTIFSSHLSLPSLETSHPKFCRHFPFLPYMIHTRAILFFLNSLVKDANYELLLNIKTVLNLHNIILCGNMFRHVYVIFRPSYKYLFTYVANYTTDLYITLQNLTIISSNRCIFATVVS